MERQEIGRFYAYSFNGVTIEFIVYDDNTMSCPDLNIDSFIRIQLKPRFIINDGEHHFEYNAQIKMPVGGGVYNGTPAPTNYMMMVTRYDIEKMNEIMSKCGAPTVVGNIPMVRPAGI